MDTGFLSDNRQQPNTVQRLLPAVVPALLISVGYIDPGKWAAAVDGGARFGGDLVLSMLLFNVAAILCHYLSAQIAVITGRDLSQICSEEYDKGTCIFLGVLTELSVVALDLTMILGTAHVFNLLFGVDMCTCIFLTVIDAVLHHVFAALLNNGKARFLCISVAIFVLLLFVLAVLFGQPETSISASGMLTKLSGESAFALMSLLGASIMPHNFYLHSSIVQREVGLLNFPKGFLWHDHFFALMCIFSGLFLVNYVLMSVAANTFYSTGLSLLTFQDALSLMDQLFRSSAMPFAFLLVLFVSSQITAFAWSLGRQAVLLEFFGLDIPGWLHHVTIRIIAIIPALYCVWNLGPEGMYQLLICTQVLVALVLPPSVIPLFRVASSKSIMGEHKISQLLEFLCLITLVGMLGLKLIFLVEMIFGDSDWVNNLRWNMGNSMSASYIILIGTALTSLCLMLWLAATPLKSATLRLDAQMWGWDLNDATPEVITERLENDYNETKHDRLEFTQKQEDSLALGSSSEVHQISSAKNTNLDMPKTLLDSDNASQFSISQENSFNLTGTTLLDAKKSESEPPTAVPSAFDSGDSVCESVDSNALSPETANVVEKSVKIGEDLHSEKDERDFRSNPSVLSEGPGSYRNLSLKTEESGSGAGSLSRLAGLGRAGRRQFAALLDEFWGQLFDFHGLATPEAKAKKLDLLLGIESKGDQKPATPAKMGANPMEFGGYVPSVSGGGSDSLLNSNLYNSSVTSYGVQRGPSLSLSSETGLLDAYAQNYSGNAFDLNERRYSSLRIPSSYGDQPATVHGYQLSYLSELTKQRASDILNGKIEALPLKTPTFAAQGYKDSPAFVSGRRQQNGLSTPPGFTKPTISRNISLQSKSAFNHSYSHGPYGNPGNAVSEKKFYSSPDISKLSLSVRESYLSGRGAQWDSPGGYGTLYSNAPTTAGSPLAFDDLAPSKPYMDSRSLFTKQPFEQLGMANASVSSGVEAIKELYPETSSVEDLNADLLRSFRLLVTKLLKLDGSEWLFRRNDGADEDLVERVAARERFMHEAETRDISQGVYLGESQFLYDKNTVPHCGEGCVWGADMMVSFGVWCIRRVLELSLMESRPELWGKYTYVLNRLQGIIDLAFSKSHNPKAPCFCLQIPATYQQKCSPPAVSNGSLPPPLTKQTKGKCTSAAMLLEVIKDVEIAISCRKGRSGTAAGDVAFPKGKENLASVLKRYKRRLSSK